MAGSPAGALHPAGPAASRPFVKSEAQDTTFFVPLFLGGPHLATGVALSNLGADDAEVSFTAFSPNGIPLWNEVRWEGPSGTGGPGALPAGEQRAVHVWEIFGLAPAADEHQGWLSIRSSSPSVRVIYQFVSPGTWTGWTE